MDFCVPCIRPDNQLFRIRKVQKTQFQPNMSMDFLYLLYPLPLMGHLIKTAYYYSVYTMSARLNWNIKWNSTNDLFHLYHLDKMAIWWDSFENSIETSEKSVHWYFLKLFHSLVFQFEIQLPESPLHESSPSFPPAHNWVGINLSPVTLYRSLHRSKLKPSTSTLSLISLFDAVNRHSF